MIGEANMAKLGDAKKAAAARARMAKRAKRARFWKENKKRITYVVICFLLVVFLAFFTPIGPDYYYSTLLNRKMATRDTVAPSYVKDLYGLGMFYNYTMRKEKAVECFDEIGQLYFGFKITDYAKNPDNALERRQQAEDRIKKGLGYGPPFKIEESELKYVGNSVWKVGEIIGVNQSKQFVNRIYDGLYMLELNEKHQNSLDPGITAIVKASVDRFAGRR